MKKIILSIAAVAALAACTKSEVQYEQTGEITLAPVTNTVTKSVAGYDYGISDNFYVGGNEGKFDGVFPTAIDLYVFANAGAEGSAANAHNEPYFRNAQFEWAAGGSLDSFDHDNNAGTSPIPTAGAYAGNPPRYWPNVKTLVFAGYSDACGLSKTTPTMNFATNVLTIPEYTQNNAGYTAEGANDLMWFSCTEPYSKQTNEIVAEMKHACSWITVNVKGEGAAIGWILNSLVVKNIAHTATAKCGETSATWDNYDPASHFDEDYYRPSTGEQLSGTSTEYATVKNGENTITAVTNNFIVIPQTPTTLEVTYSYVSDAANHITFTETKSVELDYDGVDGNSKWESGVHYIYNLTITATEILIDPVVVDWTPNYPTIPAI